MLKFKLLAVMSLIALAACQPRTAPQLGTDGQPLPVAYRIDQREAAEIPGRVLQQINKRERSRQRTGRMPPAAIATAAVQYRTSSQHGSRRTR